MGRHVPRPDLPLRLLLALAVAITLALASCHDAGHGHGRGEAIAVPRPAVWPRVATMDTLYSAVPGLPLRLEANDGAACLVDSSGHGLTVYYPPYHASVYITVTPATSSASEASVVANRCQRIDLNIGGRPRGEAVMESPDGRWRTTFVSSPTAITTPLQWITTGPGWVISGTVFFHTATPSTPPDSVAPMVDVIGRDLAHMMSTLVQQD